MTLDVELNPPRLGDRYLAALNECFPGWGDRAFYRWCFERSVGSHAPDLMVLREGGELLAGSAVSYRRIATPRAGELVVGIMTGSWTLPAARGRGCFSRIIEESQRIAAARGAALLLAFVTETNASFRRLEAAGSGLVPAWYVASNASTPSAAPVAAVATTASEDEETLRRLAEQAAELGAGRCRIVYPDHRAWASQIVQRPRPTSIVRLDERWGVIEEAGASDRIQFVSEPTLIGPLLARAQQRERQLFLYTTDAGVRDAAATCGLSAMPGYLTILVADPTALGTSPVDAKALADPAARDYLGAWWLQSGDRM